MSETTAPRTPTLEFVCQADIRVGEPLELGQVSGQRKRVIPILGGDVSGPLLTAKVLPGGADWQAVGPRGVTEVMARYTLQAADGALVSVTNRGVRRGPPEIMQRLLAGEAVDPALYYFRASPVFEVAAGPHQWLMESLFVCTGARWPDRVALRLFAIQ
jgi:hypothetical protein